MSFKRKALFVGLAAAVVVAGAVVIGASLGGRQPASGSQHSSLAKGLPAVQRVGVQTFDLPPGFRLCPYSGDFDAYLRNLKALHTGTDKEASDTWTGLRQAGAVAGYVVFYGGDAAACDNLRKFADERKSDKEKETITKHPRFAYSVVIQFPDEAAASAAFKADLLRQSELNSGPALNVVEGDATGLGPNSIVVTNQGSSQQVRRVAWQHKSFAVLFSTTDMALHSSESITTAMNLRIA